MITLNLIRTQKLGKAVTGYMDVPYGLDTIRLHTLENADYIIPEGNYLVKQTWSPRFQRLTPQVMNVPERDGIRFHKGTIPEHSTGCILVTPYGDVTLKTLFNQLNQTEDDEENAFNLSISSTC